MRVATPTAAPALAGERARGFGQAALGLVGIAVVLALAARFEAADALRFPLAWACVLCALDGAVRARSGRSPLDSAARWLLCAAASVLFWDLFELLNLRLRDWWYTGLPPRWWEGALFSALSFATVLPAVRLGEALLDPARLEKIPPAAAAAESARRTLLLALAGLLALGLALAFPRHAFPLAWLFLWPLAEALLAALGPRRAGVLASPLEALREGDRGPALRLLLLGIPLGLVWEGLNHGCARGWVYTVPFFEEHKLFEMPLAGYLGYPPFLLEAGALLALCDRLRERLSQRPPRLVPLVACILLAVSFHLGCDALGRAYTAVSFASTLAEAGMPQADRLLRVGIATPRALVSDVAAQPGGVEALAARSSIDAASLRWLASLSLLAERTGMGLGHATVLADCGVGSVEALARLDRAGLDALQARLAGSGDALDPALLRLWARKAASGPLEARGVR